MMTIFTKRNLVAGMVMLLALFGAAWADETLTFSGKLTLTSGGNQTKIDGKDSIPLPEILKVETQDDDPGVMAGLFAENGFPSKPAAITVTASAPFTVSGKGVNGVFALKGKGDNAKLESVGGENSPYKIPASKGDYYIGIDYEGEAVDAAVMQYVKITVK